jgi:hypothetical protein
MVFNLAIINNDLNDYFMRPISMTNGLLVYPINIYNYEEFKQLASQYIILDIKSINNIAKQEFTENKKRGVIPKKEEFKQFPSDNLFDYLVTIINQNQEIISKIKYINNIPKEDLIKLKEQHSDDIPTMKLIEIAEENQYRDTLQGILKLLEMVTKSKVVFIDDNFVVNNEDKEFKINRDNFYELREYVMWQNILFEPPNSPDKRSNEMIQQAIKTEFGGNEDSGNLASICSVVSCNSGVSDSELQTYTYYRLI